MINETNEVWVGINEKNIAPKGIPMIKYGILLPNFVLVLSDTDPIIGWIMTPMMLSNAIKKPIKKKDVRYSPSNNGTWALYNDHAISEEKKAKPIIKV